MPIEEKKFATVVKVTIPIPKEEAECMSRIIEERRFANPKIEYMTYSFSREPYIEFTFREK